MPESRLAFACPSCGHETVLVRAYGHAGLPELACGDCDETLERMVDDG